MLIVAPAALAAPPNDNFANAAAIQRLDDQASTNRAPGTTEGASTEFNEPEYRDLNDGPASPLRTVWYSWTPTYTEDALVGLCAHIPGLTAFTPLLGAFSGTTITSLTPVGVNEPLDCDGDSTADDIMNQFQAVGGTTYHFGVGDNTTAGQFVLVLEQRPQNDAFANSTLLNGSQGQFTGDNVFASAETGEPSHGVDASGFSIWYRWKAPFGGKASFNTCGSEVDTQLAVYTGASIDALTPVAANADASTCSPQSKVSFAVQKDVVYRVAVDSDLSAGGPGSITLNYIGYKTPNTTITGGPTGPTRDATPTFTFSSSVAGSTFRCRFDAHAFAPCSGPGATHTPATALTNGAHTFSVRAVNGLAADPTPATRSFTVDTVRPQTTITSGPSGVTHDNTPTFRFSSNETGATFQCLIRLASGTGSFGSCSGPGASHTPSLPLANGKYVFSVRARDKAGNLDATPASHSFTVAP